MKKSLIITLLTLSVTLLNAQKKDTTKSTVSYDTLWVERNTIILDSVQYSNLINFLKQFPIGNEYAQYIYSLFNGVNKNVFTNKVPFLKPKNKK
jgi:hypothetical protein